MVYLPFGKTGNLKLPSFREASRMFTLLHTEHPGMHVALELAHHSGLFDDFH